MSQFITKHDEVISLELRQLIANRHHRITKLVNNQYWNSMSEEEHSIYVGSYGRSTAISTGDIDILVELPRSEYDRFCSNTGNIQSRLLQDVRATLKDIYPHSDIRADGQIVKINFYDGMKFEILPAFRKVDYWGLINEEYDYPDTNTGGNWRATNPKSEQIAVKEKNRTSNGLYNATCRHIRFVRDTYFSSYHLAGIVIDSFVYEAMGSWYFSTSTSASVQQGSYESRLESIFRQQSLSGNMNLLAPGSKQPIDATNSIECLGKVLNYIAN